MPNSIENIFGLIWVKNWAVEAEKVFWADSTLLRLIDWPKKSGKGNIKQNSRVSRNYQDQKRIREITYRNRAIKGRALYSKIIFWSLGLSHKKLIKIVF